MRGNQPQRLPATSDKSEMTSVSSDETIQASGNAVADRGLFFLANDGVYDLVVAFLNSLRLHNPFLPVCFIPFDDNVEMIRSLSGRYRFSEYNNTATLHACDQISFMIHGSVKGHYRKLACFEGEFRDFIYIDCDTIVSGSVDFAFPLLANFNILFSHSDEPGLKRWVWRDSVRDSGLSPGQVSFAANTGFIVSQRHTFRVSCIYAAMPMFMQFVPHMALICAEQPFINLLVVTSKLRYGSLLAFVKSGASVDLPLERWAGGGPFRWGDSVRHVSNNVFLYHWAGSWAPTNFDRWVDAALRVLFPTSRPATVRRLMANGRIWRRYRRMNYIDPIARNIN